MCSSVVVALLESDFLEAAVDDLVELRHSRVADCHATPEPVKHCRHRQPDNQLSAVMQQRSLNRQYVQRFVVQSHSRPKSKVSETQSVSTFHSK